MVSFLCMHKLSACKIMQVQYYTCTCICTCNNNYVPGYLHAQYTHNDVRAHKLNMYIYICVGGAGKTGKAVILKDWNESSFVSGALYSTTQCCMYNSNLA